MIQQKKKKNQATVVLGKNVRLLLLRSFGMTQDRIPAPTRETGHRINRNAKLKNWKRHKKAGP